MGATVSEMAEAMIHMDRTIALVTPIVPMLAAFFGRVVLGFALSLPQVWAQTNLPAWPLAVKAPFFNSWYVGGTSSVPLSSASPINWSFEDMGWYSAIIVDGAAFRLMGANDDPPIEPAQQLLVELTPTRTMFAMQAGPVFVNLTFFTPVTPTDLVRQSIPFSYLYATVMSSDSSAHSVKIYSAILSDWVTGNVSLPVTSNGVVENDNVILSSQLQNPQAFTTVGGTMRDGTVYYATKMTNASNVTYQIGSDVRSFALNSTGLLNTAQSPSPSSLTNELGLYVDLGDVSASISTAVWAIGFYRDPAVHYEPLSGESQFRSSYFFANFSSPQDVVSFFLNDFDNAVQEADIFDAKVTADAEGISPTYKDLVIPVIRQVMTTLDITIAKNSDQSWNTSDTFAFMYDLGLTGFNGPNPVDILYAAFPALLYLNPAIGGYLLKPTLELHDTYLYSQPYAAVNLGLGYPNVTVPNKPHNFGIETSANMIIMALAHFRASGDPSLISQHYGLLKNWADYLLGIAMNPGNQMTSPADFITLTNQTNVSLKGILGIAAMAKISDHLGNANDSSTFQEKAKSYIQQWQTLSTSEGGDRLLCAFGAQDSGGLIYNMYADKLLQLDLVSDAVHQMQTSFYATQFTSSSNPYGIPLDYSVPDIARADWIMFAAAAAVDNTTRDDMLSAVHRYINSGINDSPLGPLYNPMTGGLNFSARGASSPAMGAMFSLLAMSSSSNNSSGSAPDPNHTTTPNANGEKHTMLIIGAVVGAAVSVGLVVALMYAIPRVRNKRQKSGIRSTSANGNEPISRPTQPRSLRQGAIEPHPDILFHKFPEGPILRLEKNRDDIAFTPNSLNTISASNTGNSSQSSQLTTETNSSLSISNSLQSSAGHQDSNNSNNREAQLSVMAAVERVLIIGEGGGNGTIVLSEAPPLYEERESPFVDGPAQSD